MTEVSKLSLADLYKLRKLWADGINVSYQTQYIKNGIQLRNNKTGKDLLFSYNKVFSEEMEPFLDMDFAQSCFIKWTKTYSSAAKEAKYTMKQFNYTGTGDVYMVDGYPFKESQLCFLDSEFLSDDSEDFEIFARAYVERFIEYKEIDLSNKDITEAKSEAGIVFIPTGNLCNEIELPKLGQDKQNKTKEGKKMNNTLTNAAERAQEVTKRAIEINKEAAILAAKLEVGNVAVQQIKNQIKVPWLMKGYKNHPLFDIALANVVGVALRELAPDNEKAQILSEAMVQSAVVQMTQSFNINDMVNDLVKNIDLSKITGSK